MNNEIWKPVPGYEELYDVSNKGRLKRTESKKRYRAGRITKGGASVTGYLKFGLSDGKGKRKLASAHRVVMEAFVGPCPEGWTVNHINGDKTDNRIENLEYVTRADNARHAWNTGLVDNRGEKCGAAKLTEAQVLDIWQSLQCTGATATKLASQYGVSEETIYDIKTRRTWRHLLMSREAGA